MDSSSFSNPSSCESTSIASTKDQYKKKNNKTKGGSAVRRKLSTDPQSVAARQRRHRISDRFKILQSLVPGGSKMDTVSMLEEAIQYVKFLKSQIWLHQAMINLVDHHDPTLFSDQLNNNSYSAEVPNYFQHDQMADMYCSNYSGNQQGLQEYYYSLLQGDENGCFYAPFQN